MRILGLLIFPDFQILDVAGPIAAFEIADRFVPGSYEIRVLAKAGGLVASSSGVRMAAEALADAPRLDTLMISGGDGTRTPAICPETLDFVRCAARAARRTTSVCSGAYVLAQAGLLDGRRCTTHWSRTKDFVRRYPKARLEMETGGRFDALLAWARENLREPLTVEDMAARAAMSERNFARAFAAETGFTPAKAIERLRVEAARALLDSQPLQVEDVALETGFGDAERMRRAFVRAFGQPPQALRRSRAS